MHGTSDTRFPMTAPQRSLSRSRKEENGDPVSAAAAASFGLPRPPNTASSTGCCSTARLHTR